MTESGQPNRDQELENIVDEIGENVEGEREAEGVPGKPSDREKESKKDAGAPEPTA